MKYKKNCQTNLPLVLQAGTVLVIKEPDAVNKEAQHTSAPQRSRADPAAKKSRAPVKPPPDPDAIFPCKKCGRYV